MRASLGQLRNKTGRAIELPSLHVAVEEPLDLPSCELLEFGHTIVSAGGRAAFRSRLMLRGVFEDVPWDSWVRPSEVQGGDRREEAEAEQQESEQSTDQA